MIAIHLNALFKQNLLVLLELDQLELRWSL
jgi:hypothetical protein